MTLCEHLHHTSAAVFEHAILLSTTHRLTKRKNHICYRLCLCSRHWPGGNFDSLLLFSSALRHPCPHERGKYKKDVVPIELFRLPRKDCQRRCSSATESGWDWRPCFAPSFSSSWLSLCSHSSSNVRVFDAKENLLNTFYIVYLLEYDRLLHCDFSLLPPQSRN